MDTVKTKMNCDNDKPLKVGDLAKRTGKTVRTIRYYEELGLLESQNRTDGGFRLYSDSDVHRVETISCLSELGFSLEQVRVLVNAWRESQKGVEVSEKIKGALEDGLKEARNKIKLLQDLERQIVTSLTFLKECGVCDDKPARHTCQCCTKGEHKAELPSLVDALVLK